MLAHRKNRRFSLLSLEEGEIYYEDFACSYTPMQASEDSSPASSAASTAPIPIDGRLHLCSAGLIFEPDNVKFPIVRLSLDKVDMISCGGLFADFPRVKNLLMRSAGVSGAGTTNTASASSLQQALQNCLLVQTNLLVEFKKHNRNDPFKSRKIKTNVLFQFKYGTAKEIMDKIAPVAVLWLGHEPSMQRDGSILISRYEHSPGDNHSNSAHANHASSSSSLHKRQQRNQQQQQQPSVRESVSSWWNSLRGGSSSKKHHNGSSKQKKSQHSKPSSSSSSRKRAVSKTTAMLNKSRIIEELCSRFEQHMQTSKFDESWLEDFREENKCELNSHRITPLVDQAGRLLLTQKRLYFQPYDKISSKPVKKYDLNQIYCIVKRRRLLRHIGLEIFMKNDKSLFFTFESAEKRNLMHDEMTKLGVRRLKSSMSEMTIQWQNGNISNFDYLLYLNFMADRTFNDLSQYPVFPWIIKDYNSRKLDLNSPDTFRDLSKPIGALNEQVFQSLWERYKEMPDPKFLYGTHYSSEAYVLYYLVRQIPEYMLRLQNGKFDAPDRMFHSVRETWDSIMENASDVKELLPEFYHSTGNFLRNTEALNLGTRQNNQKVNHVILPRWSNNDPKEFVYLNRMALESEYVSTNLHKWIDLIFGYKQTGEEAEKAGNVFYHLSYEGAVDVSTINDAHEKKAIESQIKSFGQTPKQLFKQPHPSRLVTRSKKLPTKHQIVGSDVIPLDPILNTVHTSSSNSLGGTPTTVKPLAATAGSLKSPIISDDPLPSFVPPMTSLSLSPVIMNQEQLASTNVTGGTQPDNSSDGLPSFNGMHSTNQTDSSKTNPSPMESHKSSAHQKTPEKQPEARAAIHTESLFNLENLNITFRNVLHRDSISSCILNKECNKIYTASHDATSKIFSVKNKRQTRRLTGMGDMALSSCFVLNGASEETLLISSYNNNMYVYSTAYGRILDTITGHEDAISQVRQHQNLLISGSYDCTVKIWSHKAGVLDKAPRFQFCEHDTEVNCVNFERSHGNLACSGSMDGDLIVYDLRSGKSVYDLNAHEGSSVQDAWFVPGDETRILTAGKDGCIKTIQVNVGEVECIENEEAADEDGFLCMDIVDSNHFLVGGQNGVLYAYRYNDSKLVFDYDLFKSGGVSSVYVGHKAIVAGSESGEICLLKE